MAPRRAFQAGRAALGLCAAGAILHAYTLAFKTSNPPVELADLAFLGGLFLWSCLPYALCAFVAARPQRGGLALGAALGMLAVDLYVHYSVFLAPGSSTAALGLLFAPIVNLALAGPIGGAVAWLLLGRESRWP